MQDRMEESRRQMLEEEKNERLSAQERLSAHERELREYRALMDLQENEFGAYRSKLKEEQLQRERQFQQEIEERERLFSEREKQLVERQRNLDRQLSNRMEETDARRRHLEVEIANREAQLQLAFSELEQEKERYKEEGRKRIQTNSKSYVSDALDSLDRKERQFHLMSKLWSSIGVSGLIAGLAFFIYISLSAAGAVPGQVSWPFLGFVIFKGLIAVALVAGLAKYSFLFSSYYMQEALKNADRQHAINFGKFYLESYGAAAEWSQVKEAFEHWNIAATNAFSRSEAALPDISVLERSAALIERITKALPKAAVGGGG